MKMNSDDQGPRFAFDEVAEAVDVVHAATAFYTSTHVVEGILRRVGWPGGAGLLLDPGCGDGSFLVCALAALEIGQDDERATRRVRGVEFHPRAVGQARERVCAHLVGRGWTPAVALRASREIVIEADFLKDGPLFTDVTYLVSNPPYLRTAYVPKVLRDFYEQRVPAYARADLMHAFVERSVAAMAPDGVMGLVVPDRLLFNETTAQLRAELGRLVGIEYLTRLDPTTSFYREKQRAKGAAPRVHPVEIILRPAATAARPLTAEPIFPDADPDEEGCQRLGDVAEVRLAPWLGPRGMFVVDADTAQRLPKETLLPAVDARDVLTDREEIRKPHLFAIVTRRDAPPSDVVAAHLRANQHVMPARGRRREYWLPPESITLPTDRPALLIPRIAKRLRVIDLPQGVLPINHQLTVIARKDGGMTLDEIREQLLSPETQAWIATHMPSVDNGYRAFNPGLLRRIPIRTTKETLSRAA